MCGRIAAIDPRTCSSRFSKFDKTRRLNLNRLLEAEIFALDSRYHL